VQPTSVIGCDAPQLIEFLVAENSEIKSIKLFRPKAFPPAQDVPTIPAGERHAIQEGLRLRDSLGLSFWDSTLLFISTHPVAAGNLLEIATRHNPQNADFIMIPRSECREDNFRETISRLTNGQILAISSAVATFDGVVRHVPMLDFHCKESPANLNTVKVILRELRLNGYIAMSGGSYHFYGRKLIDEQQLILILARALLFSPVVDHRWIGHQLIERACGLRISPGKEYAKCPQIIAEV
jgi:hypothetical protein